jgi:TIR domain
MTGVFINYRSADGRIAAEAIFRELAANFGPEHVFLDKQAILPGVAYPAKIRSWIHEQCSVMAAVIGPDWLGAQDDDGNQLLSRPRDWVHDEIADALVLGLPVLPVPIYDTPLPAAEDLPPAIAGLVTRQAMRIRRFDEDDDMRILIHCIKALDPGLAGKAQEATPDGTPAWVAAVSDILQRSAAQIYSVAYKPEIAAPLIRLTQALGGATASTASMLGHMPDRKAAAILEAMDRRKALLILRAMDPSRRGLIMEHLPAGIRYLTDSADYAGSDDT